MLPPTALNKSEPVSTTSVSLVQTTLPKLRSDKTQYINRTKRIWTDQCLIFPKPIFRHVSTFQPIKHLTGIPFHKARTRYITARLPSKQGGEQPLPHREKNGTIDRATRSLTQPATENIVGNNLLYQIFHCTPPPSNKIKKAVTKNQIALNGKKHL